MMRRSTMKKDNNSGKNRESKSKSARCGSPGQRETKEVCAELVKRLREKLNPKVASVGLAKDRPQNSLRPNLDGLTVGVDLGDLLATVENKGRQNLPFRQ
jgi:hypothetical protein